MIDQIKNHSLKITHGAMMAMAFFTTWATTASHVAFLCFVICWLLSGNFGEKWARLKNQPIAWLSIAWMIWMIASTQWSPASFFTQKVILEQHIPLLAVPLFISVLTNQKTQICVLQAYYWGIVVLMLTAIAQVLGWQGGYRGFRYGFTEFSGTTGTVLHGPSVALIIYLSAIFAWLNQRYRWLFIAMACWGLFDLMLMLFNRTSLLVLTPLLITLAVIGIKKSQHPQRTIVLLLLISVGLFFTTGIQERINSTYQEIITFNTNQNPTSSGVRFFYLQLTSHMFFEHPLIGHGIGAFRHLIHDVQQYHAELSRHWHSHNTYMNLAADLGIIGLLIYLSLLIYAIKNIFSQSNALLKLASIGGLITIIFCGMTDSIIHLMGYMPMIFLALTLNLSHSATNTSKPNS